MAIKIFFLHVVDATAANESILRCPVTHFSSLPLIFLLFNALLTQVQGFWEQRVKNSIFKGF